ncbi:hypothetical protein LEMLEM_LOCUS1608 [Lemmus lemmus]
MMLKRTSTLRFASGYLYLVPRLERHPTPGPIQGQNFQPQAWGWPAAWTPGKGIVMGIFSKPAHVFHVPVCGPCEQHRLLMHLVGSKLPADPASQEPGKHSYIQPPQDRVSHPKTPRRPQSQLEAVMRDLCPISTH